MTGLREIWDSSELFTQIRQRDHLGGRCGPCELSSLCGGCRARAYGMTGDVMAEDPLCTHQPGTLAAAVDRLRSADAASTEYAPAGDAGDGGPALGARGQGAHATHPGLRARHGDQGGRKLVRENGVAVVTATALEEIRARMPTPKVFGAKIPSSTLSDSSARPARASMPGLRRKRKAG